MEIWTPREVAARCHVPVEIGERGVVKCGKPFYVGEERDFQRHVVACAKEHAEVIHEASPRQRLPGFLGDEAGDVERERWTMEHRDEILEGRMTDSYGTKVFKQT